MVGERMRNETLCRLLRLIHITFCQSGSADAEFSRHSDRHWLQVLVKDINLIITDGTADGYRCRRPRADIIIPHGERATAHRRFGGTVMIDYRAIAGLQNTIDQVPA